jgi:hypothetical protein
MSLAVRHVVMFSGGTGSWATARRVADLHGTANLTLLFADTLAEHPDLHRFLSEAAADIGVPVTRVCDGRTPHQVDVDRRWLSNSQVAQCSLELKIKPCRKWLAANCDPDRTVLYVGIDYHSDAHPKTNSKQPADIDRCPARRSLRRAPNPDHRSPAGALMTNTTAPDTIAIAVDQPTLV